MSNAYASTIPPVEPSESCPARLAQASPKFPANVLRALRGFKPSPISAADYRGALDHMNRFAFALEPPSAVAGSLLFLGNPPAVNIDRFTNMAAAADRELLEKDIHKDYETFVGTSAWRNGREAHAGLETAEEIVTLTHPGAQAQAAFLTWIGTQTALATVPRLGLFHYVYAPISRRLAAEISDVFVSDGGELAKRLRATRIHVGGDFLEDCIVATIRSITEHTRASAVEFLVHAGFTTVQENRVDRILADVRATHSLRMLDEEIDSEMAEIDWERVRRDLTAAEPFWEYKKGRKRITIRLVP